MSTFLLVFCLAIRSSFAQDAPADAPAPWRLEGNDVVLASPVTFETGSATLTADAAPALDAIKAYLDAKSYISTLRIEGHVAEQGDPTANQALTEQRALAVSRALVAKGVDCKRLLPVGFGSNKPVADGSTPEGRAQNTRVAFVNAALRDRAIGGMPLDGGARVAGDPCAVAP